MRRTRAVEHVDLTVERRARRPRRREVALEDVAPVVACGTHQGRYGKAEGGQRRVEVDIAGAVGRPSLHESAVGGDQLAERVEGEGTRTGVQLLAALVHHEEAVARDHHVGLTVGELRGALLEVGGDTGHLDAQAHLRGVRTTDARLGGTRVGEHLGQRVLELHLRRLEARGVDVGDVVAGDVEHRLVGAKAGDSGEE